MLLEAPAVCGFVGRNQKLSMDENLVDFEASFIPLLKEAKARGLQYRIEQCYVSVDCTSWQDPLGKYH